MPRSRGDKGAPKNTEGSGKGKRGEVGESAPKAPEAGGPPGSPDAESRHGGHGRKNSKKGAGDHHAASTKAYSPFLNTVFGKVGALGGRGQRMEGMWEAGDGAGFNRDGGDAVPSGYHWAAWRGLGAQPPLCGAGEGAVHWGSPGGGSSGAGLGDLHPVTPGNT